MPKPEDFVLYTKGGKFYWVLKGKEEVQAFAEGYNPFAGPIPEGVEPERFVAPSHGFDDETRLPPLPPREKWPEGYYPDYERELDNNGFPTGRWVVVWKPTTETKAGARQTPLPPSPRTQVIGGELFQEDPDTGNWVKVIGGPAETEKAVIGGALYERDPQTGTWVKVIEAPLAPGAPPETRQVGPDLYERDPKTGKWEKVVTGPADKSLAMLAATEYFRRQREATDRKAAFFSSLVPLMGKMNRLQRQGVTGFLEEQGLNLGDIMKTLGPEDQFTFMEGARRLGVEQGEGAGERTAGIREALVELGLPNDLIAALLASYGGAGAGARAGAGAKAGAVAGAGAGVAPAAKTTQATRQQLLDWLNALVAAGQMTKDMVAIHLRQYDNYPAGYSVENLKEAAAHIGLTIPSLGPSAPPPATPAPTPVPGKVIVQQPDKPPVAPSGQDVLVRWNEAKGRWEQYAVLNGVRGWYYNGELSEPIAPAPATSAVAQAIIAAASGGQTVEEAVKKGLQWPIEAEDIIPAVPRGLEAPLRIPISATTPASVLTTLAGLGSQQGNLGKVSVTLPGGETLTALSPKEAGALIPAVSREQEANLAEALVAAPTPAPAPTPKLLGGLTAKEWEELFAAGE